ncbi:MAG TPA: hypothetical protein VL947_04535 [Cytophagales bacterium]|nr:hypothetical protein [Cytophagales bacterium]
MLPKIKCIFIFIVASFCFHVCANDSTLIKSVPLKDIEQVTHDEFYNLYICTGSGQIHKYDSKGNYLLSNSPAKPQRIHNIEALNTIRIFCFYRELQEFNYFDRFLTFENSIRFDPSLIGYARTATVSSDNGIWLFDEADYTIKKYDPVSQKLLHTINYTQVVQGDQNVTFMKEYQNKLYVMNRDSGIAIFDNMGNFSKKIRLPGITQISFYKDEMYALCGKTKYTINLYDALSVQSLALDTSYSVYFRSEQYKYFFQGHGFKITKAP